MNLVPGHSDRVPRAVKRDTSLSDNTTALARLIAEGRIGPVLGVTARGKTDGAGAQAMAAISALAVAQSIGCRYLHSPFTFMEHAEGTPEEWAARWEAFLNFGDGELSVPEHVEMVPLAAPVEDPAAYRDRPIVIAQTAYGPSNAVPAISDSTRDTLRAKYWRSPKAALVSHRAVDGLTVAFHLRRGDVSPRRCAIRYMSDEVALRQIDRLRRALAPFGHAITINLYSVGTLDDFRPFADAGCHLHISQDTFEAFHNMVTADILVNAQSTFSHVAALLSEGIVVDPRLGARRFSNWIKCRPNGDIWIKRTRRALLERMSILSRWAYHVRRRLPGG